MTVRGNPAAKSTRPENQLLANLEAAREDSTAQEEAAAKVNEAVKTAQTETTAPTRRGPGRPPGSKNKRPTGPIPPVVDRTKTEAEKIADKAKSDERNNSRDKPDTPNFDEWRDFLGEVVLHWFGVAFVAVAMRGIPYHDIMSDADYEDIQLDDVELKAVARPFAHLLARSNLNTKYGRAIMNSRDSIEAMVVLFMYMQRVRRIGKKYRDFMQYQMEVNPDVPRIPRPDRARDTESEIDANAEAAQPPIGIHRPAFGHGYN